MTVPTFDDVNRILSAATMRDLIRRDDLPDDPCWWLAVISVGQAGLVGAESGRPDAEEWASVLVESLDTAASRALGTGETIHRRMIACVAAMNYFGERTGDSVRDPELVFRHLTAALGGSPDVYLERYRRTLARALADHKRVWAGDGGDRRAVTAARSWMDGTRAALVQMCRDVATRLVEAPRENEPGRTETTPGAILRDEVSRWCAVLPQIEAVRSAARAAQVAEEGGTATGGT